MKYGIIKRYELANPEVFSNWTAQINDWQSMFILYLYLPNGREYANYYCRTLQAAKNRFTREVGKHDKPAKWKLTDDYTEEMK
jgi:hypothetical protein